MGVERNVGPSTWPKQSDVRSLNVLVDGAVVSALVVRDDVEHPFRRILQIPEGRFVLGCGANAVEIGVRDRWPRQGRHLGLHVKVCFFYDTSTLFDGLIVRDDAEEPFQTIIHLDDARFVLATECQYSLNE